MQLLEPQRWVTILQSLNARAWSSQALFTTISILADIIVFLFPVFLIIVYIIWMKKKSDVWKEYALRIFFSSVVAAIINIVIQLFVNKPRPETILVSANRLVLKHLPTMSFPSDHAAVSMAFWVAVYYFIVLFSQKKQKNTMQWWWIFFIIWSIIMSIARVAVGVHWPMDILIGWLVGILAVYCTTFIPEKVFQYIIMLEKKIFKFFYK